MTTRAGALSMALDRLLYSRQHVVMDWTKPGTPIKESAGGDQPIPKDATWIAFPKDFHESGPPLGIRVLGWENNRCDAEQLLMEILGFLEAAAIREVAP